MACLWSGAQLPELPDISVFTKTETSHAGESPAIPTLPTLLPPLQHMSLPLGQGWPCAAATPRHGNCRVTHPHSTCSRRQHDAVSGAAQCRARQPGKPATRSNRRRIVVATSEFWYEEEQEFDAITEQLPPKRLCICSPHACHQHLEQLKQWRFDCAFAAPEQQEEAQQLWQALGRAGPPLFLKVRSRAALGSLADPQLGDGQVHVLTDELLGELCGQSWRTALDAGLDTASAHNECESLLIIASELAVRRLRSVVTEQRPAGEHSSCSSTGDGVRGIYRDSGSIQDKKLWVIALEGWNEGTVQQKLGSWRQLHPRPMHL